MGVGLEDDGVGVGVGVGGAVAGGMAEVEGRFIILASGDPSLILVSSLFGLTEDPVESRRAPSSWLLIVLPHHGS